MTGCGLYTLNEFRGPQFKNSLMHRELIDLLKQYWQHTKIGTRWGCPAHVTTANALASSITHAKAVVTTLRHNHKSKTKRNMRWCWSCWWKDWWGWWWIRNKMYIYKYIFTCMQTYLHTYINTCIYTCAYIHAYMRTHEHAYMQACIHTYISLYLQT